MGLTTHEKMSFLLQWVNDIADLIIILLDYDYDSSIKGNVISLNWYKNRKNIAITKDLLKETLKQGIQYNFPLPYFIIEQHGDIFPELKAYNDYILNSVSNPKARIENF